MSQYDHFIDENEFENTIYKMTLFLFRGMY